MPVADVSIPRTDEEYYQWCEANPDGFVINSPRRWPPSYMMLHRVGCLHIATTHEEDGAFTQRAYTKICASDIDSLREWTRHHGRPNGDFSDECGTWAGGGVRMICGRRGSSKKSQPRNIAPS